MDWMKYIVPRKGILRNIDACNNRTMGGQKNKGEEGSARLELVICKSSKMDISAMKCR